MIETVFDGQSTLWIPVLSGLIELQVAVTITFKEELAFICRVDISFAITKVKTLYNVSNVMQPYAWKVLQVHWEKIYILMLTTTMYKKLTILPIVSKLRRSVQIYCELACQYIHLTLEEGK